MNRLRTALVAAATLAAAVLIATPAAAQCGEDDPHCAALLPDPPQSQEVAVHVSTAQVELSSFNSMPQLNTLAITIPMPAPPRVDHSDDLTSSTERPTLRFDTLPVSLRYQVPGDHDCGVQALGMALDGLSGTAPTSAAILGMLQGNGWMYDYGTGVEELAHAASAFGYQAQAFHGWSLQALAGDIAAGRPVVAALGANGPDQPGHFVTVTGVSPDSRWIAYHDPLLGERVVEAGAFDALWALQGRSGVVVRVGDAQPTVVPADHVHNTALLMSAASLLAIAALGWKRKGIGGAIEAPGDVTDRAVGMKPPYTAPEGMRWEQGDPIYETVIHRTIEYQQVPHMVQQQVQVGTTTERIPYTKRYDVDEGHWVTDYRTERYVRYYRTEKYFRYNTIRRYPRPWGGYTYKKVPVYGYRKKPVYGYRKKEIGKHWVSNWVTHETTAYKTIVKPVYELQWVHDGTYDRIPVEKEESEDVLKGYEWTLVEDPVLPSDDELPVEHLLTSGPYDPPHWVQATGNLHLRACPSRDSAHLAYIREGDLVWYTGRKTEVDGSEWTCVRTLKNGEERMGWTIGGFYGRVVASPESARPTLGMYEDACRATWYNERSADERESIRHRERQRVAAYLAEIEALIASAEPSVRVMLEEELAILRQPPEWVVAGTIPAAVYERSLLSPELVAGLKELVTWAEPTDDLWELAAGAYVVSPGDLKLQVLGGATWPASESTSAGNFPVEMIVIRKYGHMLLAAPSPDAVNVSEAFLGVPQGERVVWNGGYHVGVDADGEACTYYEVSWTVNGHTYSGWIPASCLAPQLTTRDPFAERIYGDWDNPTFGYGDGVAGWAAFHTSGAAQMLNLQALFRSMGFSEEDCAYYASRHTELCGELAVMHALGVSLEEGFARFVGLGEEFASILANPDMGTRAEQLKDFIESFSDCGWSAEYGEMSLEDIEADIHQNYQPIALVTIDGSGNVAQNGCTAHWIHVTEVDYHEDRVYFYNPICNSEEQWVSINDFNAARAQTPGNPWGNIVVVAERSGL